MATRKPGIVTAGDSRLLQRAKKVRDVHTVQSVCKRLVENLRRLKGQGLAAPQIGEDVRIAVVETRPTELRPRTRASPLYVMINPVITKRHKPLKIDWEKCFSVPGLLVRVPRFGKVEVRYVDEHGEERREVFKGHLARVVQHECDHLEGKLHLHRAGLRHNHNIATVGNFKRFVLGQHP